MKTLPLLPAVAGALGFLLLLGCPPEMAPSAGVPAVGGAGAPAVGAVATGPVDNSAARKTQVLDNLKHDFPEIGMLNPTLGDFARLEGDLDAVTMRLATPMGSKEQMLLITPDNRQLYMVLGEPLDVSRDSAAIKAEAEKAAVAKRAALDQLISGRPVLGKADAKVTIVEFSDFQCPFCKQAYASLEALLKKRGEEVRFYFLHFPLSFHQWAKPAAIATECAAQQKPEAFWALYRGYFDQQTEITTENVVDKAKALLADSGIDMARWTTCATSTESAEHQQAAAAVDQQTEAAAKLGLDGVPAIFVNGEMMNGAVPLPELEAAVQAAVGQPG